MEGSSQEPEGLKDADAALRMEEKARILAVAAKLENARVDSTLGVEYGPVDILILVSVSKIYN